MHGRKIPPLKRIAIWLVVIMIISFLLGGVVTWVDKSNPARSQSSTGYPVTIPGNNVSSAEISLNLHSGDIALSSGGSALLQSSIESGPIMHPPVVSYSVHDGIGKLDMKQTEISPFDPLNSAEKWSATISQDIPVNVSIQLGAGDIRIAPFGRNLMNLSLDSGVGDITLDLTGWNGDRLPVSVNSSVGEINVIIPESASSSVTFDQGIGSHTVSGLTGDGNRYIHQGTGQSGQVINVTINQGIGDLAITTVSFSEKNHEK